MIGLVTQGGPRVLKKGQKVVELTKKVGQHGRIGKVEATHGQSIEVRWSDGHLSIVSPASLTPKTKANAASAQHN